MLHRRLAMAAFLCLIVLRSPVAADSGERTDNAETTRADLLPGTWEMESVELMGQKIVVPKGQGQELTFNSGKVTMKHAALMRNETGSYRVNESKLVKEIDMVTPINGNPAMTQTMKGLYRIEGDTLKIAFSLGQNGNGPGDRPASFDAKDAGVLVLKRKK